MRSARIVRDSTRKAPSLSVCTKRFVSWMVSTTVWLYTIRAPTAHIAVNRSSAMGVKAAQGPSIEALANHSDTVILQNWRYKSWCLTLFDHRIRVTSGHRNPRSKPP
jgi:hypothetical protein